MKKSVYFILQLIVGGYLSLTFFKQSLNVHPDKFNYQLILYVAGMFLILISLLLITKQLANVMIKKNKSSYSSTLCFLLLGVVMMGLTFNGMLHVELLNFLIDPYFILFEFGFFVFLISGCRLVIQFISSFAKR